MAVKLAALIPAFNEETLIAQTVGSVIDAGLPREDIFVIDDGSRDATIVKARACGVNVLCNPKNLGKAESVTNALRELNLLDRYTHVSFLDADTLLDRGYFKAVRARLKKEKERKRSRKAVVLCGCPKSIPYNWLTAWRAFQYWIADTIFKPAQSKFKAITVAPGCAATYSVEVLRLIRWTAETPAEDMDATIQAVLLGASVIYESGAITYTQDPRYLKGYIGQVGRRWDTGAWQIMHKYKLLHTGWLKSLQWECRMVFLEPFAYLGLSIYWLHGDPQRFFKGLLLTFATNIGLAAIASYKEKRWDILLFSPIFSFVWLLDFYLFLSTSPNLIFGPKKKRQKWFSVERYAIPPSPQPQTESES